MPLRTTELSDMPRSTAYCLERRPAIQNVMYNKNRLYSEFYIPHKIMHEVRGLSQLAYLPGIDELM